MLEVEDGCICSEWEFYTALLLIILIIGVGFVDVVNDGDMTCY